MRTIFKFLAAFLLLAAASIPAMADAGKKNYSEKELAELAAIYPMAGTVRFTGTAGNNTFEVLHHETGTALGEGFLAGGHIYVDFYPHHPGDSVDRLCFKARVQGNWLIVEELLAEAFTGVSDYSEAIALPIKNGIPADDGVPWFRLEKAGDSNRYFLTTTWGLANFSPGAVILELSSEDLGGPDRLPVLLKREDVDDVSLLTFAVRDAIPPARFKAGEEKLYTVIYHRLREGSLGCFERAVNSTLPHGLPSLEMAGEVEIGPDEWWPPLLGDSRPHIPGTPQPVWWRIADSEILIVENGTGKITTIGTANPEERHSIAGFDGLLLGGFMRGKWAGAREVEENSEYGPGIMAFGVYGAKGHEGFGQGGELYQAYPASYTPAFDITMVDGDGAVLSHGSARLTLTGPWQAAPRQAAVLNANHSTYNKFLKDYLAQTGLPNATPNIMQLFRVDLEGDGVDEVVICAQNIVAPGAGGTSWETDKPLGTLIPEGSAKGDYSLILLRKIVNGEVRTIPLVQFIALKDGNPVNPPQVPPLLHKIYQFADLNGDGIMEIIAGENNYEGFSYLVFEIKDGVATKVLNGGAGS